MYFADEVLMYLLASRKRKMVITVQGNVGIILGVAAIAA
jgi:hypothetical protein